MEFIMKIKLSKIVSSVPAFKNLTQQTTNAKTAFRLAKMLNIIQAELDLFETTKNNIATKYQIKSEQGNIQIPEENAELFKKEILELLDEEVELNIEQLPVSELSGIANITISNMMLMEYMFKD